MYRPEAFLEDRPEVLHEFIRQNPFATLITSSRSGLLATHLPVLLDEDSGPKGSLVGHLSRANDHWRELEAATQALLIFQGPDAYVSPSLYPSKARAWSRGVDVELCRRARLGLGTGVQRHRRATLHC